MDEGANARLHTSSRQRKTSVVLIERPENLVWNGKSMYQHKSLDHRQARPLTQYDRDLREKYFLGKQSYSVQDYLNRLHLDDFHHENKNQFFNSHNISPRRNLSLPNWWTMERSSNGRIHHIDYYKGQIPVYRNHLLAQEQLYRQLVNPGIYRKRSNPLPAPSYYRNNFEDNEKHNIRQRTLTASPLLERSSALSQLDSIRHYQNDMNTIGSRFSSSNGGETKVNSGKYNQPQLPELIAAFSSKSAYADVPQNVKLYFDEPDSKNIDWNSCSIEELSNWDNVLYRLFLHRTENIFKKYEKFKLMLESEIFQRRTHPNTSKISSAES